jgi:hypothetical protein
LFFGGKPSPMIIPFQAVTSLNDPSVGFGLQFGMLDENDAEDDGTASDASISPANLKSNASDGKNDDAGSDGKSPKDDKTAEVVSLDTFRKRPTQ